MIRLSIFGYTIIEFDYCCVRSKSLFQFFERNHNNKGCVIHFIYFIFYNLLVQKPQITHEMYKIQIPWYKNNPEFYLIYTRALFAQTTHPTTPHKCDQAHRVMCLYIKMSKFYIKIELFFCMNSYCMTFRILQILFQSS